MLIFLTLLLLLSDRLADGATCDTSTTLDKTWNNGQDGKFKFNVPISTMGSATWDLVVTFDKPISSFLTWDGISKGCVSGKVCTYGNEVFTFVLSSTLY